MSFLSPLFLLAAGGGDPDRAAPPEARAGAARPVFRGPPADAGARRTDRPAPPARAPAARVARRGAAVARARVRSPISPAGAAASSGITSWRSMSRRAFQGRDSSIARNSSPGRQSTVRLPATSSASSRSRIGPEQASRPLWIARSHRDAIDLGRPRIRFDALSLALQRRAADMINASGATRSAIVLVSDMQEIGWDGGDRASVSQSTSIQLADAAPPSNLAVTALRVADDRLIATVRTPPRSRARRAFGRWCRQAAIPALAKPNAAGEASTEVRPISRRTL